MLILIFSLGCISSTESVIEEIQQQVSSNNENVNDISQTTDYTSTEDVNQNETNENNIEETTNTETIIVGNNSPQHIQKDVLINAILSPPRIFEGQSAILRWKIFGPNIESISLSNYGNIGTSGTLTLSPTETTTYTITVIYDGGKVKTKTFELNVITNNNQNNVHNNIHNISNTTHNGMEDCTVYYYDFDGDGYGTDKHKCLTQPEGYYTALQNGDCDDHSNITYPGAVEICDEFDNNCNGDFTDIPEDDEFWIFVDWIEDYIATSFTTNLDHPLKSDTGGGTMLFPEGDTDEVVHCKNITGLGAGVDYVVTGIENLTMPQITNPKLREEYGNREYCIDVCLTNSDNPHECITEEITKCAKPGQKVVVRIEENYSDISSIGKCLRVKSYAKEGIIPCYVFYVYDTLIIRKT